MYNVYNTKSIRNLTTLWVNYAHSVSIAFDTALTALALVVHAELTGNDDSEHFFVDCSQFNSRCTDLFSQLADVPGLDTGID